MKHVKHFIYGALMGIGELIPGVGAQTAAIIGGFYDEIILFLYNGTELLKNILLWIIRRKTFTEVKKSFLAINWVFWIVLTLGSLVTLLLGGRLMHFLLGRYPLYVFAAAFGIVLACLQIPFQEMKKKGSGEFIIFLTTLIAFLFFFEQQPGALGGNINIFTMFIAGLVCSLAGFFPGISISFALLIFGLYDYILSAADKALSLQMDATMIINLIAFAVGLNLGLIVTIRTLKFLFEKYQSYLLAFILGLIAASLRVVWPFMDVNSSPDPEHMVKLTPLGLSYWQSGVIFVIIFTTFMVISLLRQYAMKQEDSAKSSFGFGKITEEQKTEKEITAPKKKKKLLKKKKSTN
jgi:putative membrane protein